MTTTGQKYDAHRNAMNEGGEGFNPYEEQIIAEAQAKTEDRIQHIIANLDEYRARWNAAVAKHSVGGQIAAAAIRKVEQEAGVSLHEMKLVKSRMAA